MAAELTVGMAAGMAIPANILVCQLVWSRELSIASSIAPSIQLSIPIQFDSGRHIGIAIRILA
jgi:hypothetical protein